MTSTLGPLDATAVLTGWTVQPVALLLTAVLAVGYARGLGRLTTPWPASRTALFACGLALLAWTSCGVLGAYASSLYWVWTSQTLILWLFVPILILSGHPVQLARATRHAGPGSPDTVVERVLASRFGRVVANPLVGPALVPLLSFVLFFGPLPGWAIAAPEVGWVLQLALVAVGALMVLPLAGLDERASSLVVGLGLAIGSFELVIDAFPGVVLRLHQGLVTSYFDHRAAHVWTPPPLQDQHVAGAVLWCVAEIIDLPFLLLVYRRWLRADARDAAAVDAVLEAERAAQQAIPASADRLPGAPPSPDEQRDTPWWLSDPVMRERMRHRE